MAKKATVNNFNKPENYRKLRESLGLTQTAFWASVGETQSNGSRIEAGKAAGIDIPVPQMVLHDAAKESAARAERQRALQMAREALDTVSSNNKSFRGSIIKIYENQQIDTDGKGENG